MRLAERLRSDLTIGAFIIGAYVLCFGLTTYLVNPLQDRMFGDVTLFASLVYLPHGVRVLSTWAWRGRAVLPLVIGELLADRLLTGDETRSILQPAMLPAALAGSLAAFVIFEALHRLGHSCYAGANRALNWKELLVIGALASIINSVGHNLAYDGILLPERNAQVLVMIALGDTLGLLATMAVLMLIFRLIRLRRG